MKLIIYKSIDSVNIGALPFLPRKTRLAEELLEKLIGESDESAFERTILPKGIEERLAIIDWNRRDVLVGSLKSKEQWEDCYCNNYYYVPVKNIPVDSKQPNYIAIYHSKNLYGKNAGIKYYGEILKSEIVSRKEVNDLPSHASPEEKYVKYSIQKWNELDRIIEFESEWVYRPRYTNLFLLQNCKKTFELFNIKSDADYRLVSELRRIQSNIVSVQDTPKDLFVKVNEDISIYCDDGFIHIYYGDTEVFNITTDSFKRSLGAFISQIQHIIDYNVLQ